MTNHLQRSEATMRAIVETAITAIITIDAKGTVLSFNPAAEKLFDYSSSEVIGCNVKILMPNPFHAEHDGYLSRYMSEGKPRVIGIGREVICKRKDNSTFPADLAVSEIAMKGEKKQFVGILTDITERKRIDIANQYYAAIVQSSDDAIMSKDVNNIITGWNPGAERIFGYTAAEMIGDSMSKLFPPEHFDEEKQIMVKILRGETIKHFESVRVRKNGSKINVSVTISPILDNAGNVIGTSKISRDITEQKRAEQKLAEAKEAAEAGAKTKAAFVANMSHEIRTPMNAILGFSEVLLQDNSLNKDSAKNVRTIYSAAKSLLVIINDILDVSKIESGKLSLENIGFNLYNVLTDTIQTLEQHADEKNLILMFDYDSRLPFHFVGDPTRLRQIILNLVGNAIKFTPAGCVKLSVKARDITNLLHFSVTDTGIGMTSQQKEIVFDLFSQADTSTTRQFGGTGLGTTISKQIVELMGGEIWVDSIFGEGTTFHFTANLPESTTKDNCLYENEDITANTYLSPRLFRILLAEDIDVNAALATLRLEQQGHSIHWVKNGHEVINAFQEIDYDLILMDIHMPGLDGIESTRAIRKLELENPSQKRITILALTASVFREDNDKCFEAGMDGFVSKPIEFNKLFFTMESSIPEGVGKMRQHDEIKTRVIHTFDFSPLDGLIDYDKGLKTWDDSAAYFKALHLFVTEHQHDAEKILTALNDNTLAQHYVHALKGVASNLVMLEITALTKKIETDLATNQTINRLLSSLQIALENVVMAINQLKSPVTLSTTSATKIIDQNAVIALIKKLLIALNDLNPDTVEPILLALENYLEETELTQIRYQIDNFDFEEATNRTHLLVKKLGLCEFL